MSKFIICITFLLLLLSSSTAFATATTHVWGPSTDMQAFGLWHITSDVYLPTQLDKAPGVAAVRLPPVTNLGLTVGALPFEKLQMEVGVDHKSGFGALDPYPMFLNAKLGVPENALGKHFPALAVGVFDIGTRRDKTDYNVMYGKAALTFPVVGRVSGGYFSGNKKLLLDSKGKKSNSGLLAAWERTLTEWSDKAWVCIEYMGSNSAYGTLNFGFSWKASDNVSLLFGYDLLNDKDLVGAENTLTMQVDVDLKFLRCTKK